MIPRCTQPHGGSKRLVRVGRFRECQGCGMFIPAGKPDPMREALELIASGQAAPDRMIQLARQVLA